jgi:predicted ATPase
VFVGGCTLEAAEEVCDADLDSLQSLVEKSLLRHAAERFWMLETIREHSSERLVESGEEDSRRRRHACCYLAIAEASRRGLRGPDQVAWLARMVADEQNLRAALAWAVGRAAAKTALRLVWALEVFWIRGGRDDEAALWVDRALLLDCLRSRSCVRVRSRPVVSSPPGREPSSWLLDASARAFPAASARG